MSKKHDGGTAFPLVVQPDFQFAETGMSLRDYFAAKAMQAIISKVPLTSDLEGGPVTSQAVLSVDEFIRVATGIALGAYDYADAMLAAREAKP